MKGSARRICAMLIRYLYLHKRSVPRFFEIIFWPVMDLLVWGFLTLYVQGIVGDSLSKFVVFIIYGTIFWDILYRSQQAVTISIMEEIWQQNILNILVSPLKIWEWLTATFLYGLLKTAVITGVLMTITFFLYRFNTIGALGLAVIPLAGNLLLFGWVLGILTAGLLLIWGYSAEALIWGVPYLMQPVSAVFYPLTVLPLWLQCVAKLLPSTYVFEGIRAIMSGENLHPKYFLTAFGLNILFFMISAIFFEWLYRRARAYGHLVRLGMY